MKELTSADELPENQCDRYRAVVAAAIEGIVITDRHGVIVEVNTAACALLGQSRSELLRTNISAFAPAAGELSSADPSLAEPAGAPRAFRTSIERPDGTSFHCEVISQVLPNGEHLALMRDVSAAIELERLQRVARAMAERRANAGAALSRASAAVLKCSDFREAAHVIYEACKGVVGANAGYVSLINENEGDTILLVEAPGVRPSDAAAFFIPLDPLRERAFQMRTALYDNDVSTAESVGSEPDAVPTVRNALATPLILRDRVVGVMTLVDKDDAFEDTDLEYVTAFGEVMAAAMSSIRLRKDLESAARIQRLLFEGARDAIFWADGDTHLILDCNHAAEELLGRPRETLLGQHQATLHPPEEQSFYIQRFKDATDKKLLEPAEAAVVRVDGERVAVEISTSVVKLAGRTIIQGLFHDITHRKRAHEELERYRRRLSELTAELLRTDERERRQAALELHDGVGQSLAAAKMLTQRLAENCDGGGCQDFQHLLRLIDDSIAHVRGLTNELSPSVLYELGLSAALSWLVESYLERFGLHCVLVVDHTLAGLKGESSTIAFRIARELLMNVERHAGVHHANVSARLFEDMIVLGVQDEGGGFDPRVMTVDDRHDRFGLFSIREEVRRIGGTVEIDSAPGQGARVEVRIPLEVSVSDEHAFDQQMTGGL